MYLAELHGKLSSKNENREDILTSNVFSFFKYSDRIKFLKPFLNSIDIKISDNEAQNAEFVFWPVYEEGTEPDLVIITDTYYILIEAKYFSDFSVGTKKTDAQLLREINMGKIESINLDKIFKFVAITNDYFFKNEKFIIIPKTSRECFIWTNWHKVSELLSTIIILDSNSMEPENLFASDLQYLLLKKKLRKYQNIKLPHKKFYLVDTIFFNVLKSNYRDKFIGFINTFSVQKILLSSIPDYLFFNVLKSNFRDKFFGFVNTFSKQKNHILKVPDYVFFNTSLFTKFNTLKKLKPKINFKLV